MENTNPISLRNRLYYRLKPLIPRRLQVWLRSRMARRMARHMHSAHSASWPILEAAANPPPQWPGWPDQHQFALVLMHDVETEVGQRRCRQLMQVEQRLGFRSSFNFVPERYQVDPALRAALNAAQFEVGVHGLLHDGRLFESHATFQARACRINQYLADWCAVGFVSPASHHHLAWMHALQIQYDSSTFDTDPFEPQPDGLHTCFPMWIPDAAADSGYVELPYTLPQDYTLFILLREKSIDIWRRKLRWIAAKGGLALLIVHPDYISFGGSPAGYQEYPVDYYVEFLEHVQNEYHGQYWHALPRDVAAYYRSHITQRAS